jgi:hypothetical protein
MKIYVQENGVKMVGKVWEIKYMLNKYKQKYKTVQEWIDCTGESGEYGKKRSAN